MTNIEFRYYQCRYYNCTPKEYETAFKKVLEMTNKNRYKTKKNYIKKIKERLEIELKG